MKEMTDKEASIKMAEMCGYEVKDGKIDWGYTEPCLFSTGRAIMYLTGWNPRESITQAMEVLRSLRAKGICYCMSNESSCVGITLFEGDFIDEDTVICNGSAGINGELEAIFNAVKQFMEGEG